MLFPDQHEAEMLAAGALRLVHRLGDVNLHRLCVVEACHVAHGIMFQIDLPQ